MATPTIKHNRPTTEICEVCGRPVAVAARGRIAHVHPACGAVSHDFARLERSVDAATEGMSQEELAAFRKFLVGQFFHWTNGKFNAAKSNGSAKRKAKKAAAPALPGLEG